MLPQQAPLDDLNEEANITAAPPRNLGVGGRLSSHKTLSLWLIPPEPILSSLICTQQDLISLHHQMRGHEQRRLLPAFTPHVTVVGGIPISECCTLEEDVWPCLNSSSSILSRDPNQQAQSPQQLSNSDQCRNTHWEKNKFDSHVVNFNDDHTTKLRDECNHDDTIDYLDEIAAKSVLLRLQTTFRNYFGGDNSERGGVDCNFVKDRGVFAARRKKDDCAGSISIDSSSSGSGSNSDKSSDYGEEEGEVQWNQSCISIMERSNNFIKAMELADQTLFFSKQRKQLPTSTNNNNNLMQSNNNDDDQIIREEDYEMVTLRDEKRRQSSSSSSVERHFKPPSHEPHYSFIYGNDADFIQSLSSSSSSSRSSSSSSSSSVVLEPPPNFTSTEMILMWTYPSTLEGVEQWREIGRFQI